MSATVELNATEIAKYLLPLLKEYAEKMADVAQRVSHILTDKLTKTSADLLAPEIGRVVCLHDTLNKPVTDLAREASGIIEHSALEYHLRNELKLRADELDEHIRFAEVLVERLVELIKGNKFHTENIRELIKKSGRYNAPF